MPFDGPRLTAGYLDEAPTPNLAAQRDAALARCAALERLLACHRAGTQPSERLHRELARTKTRLAELLSASP